MLSASSPLVFPASSSPIAPKRPTPHDGRPKPTSGVKGPFLIEDDDDSEQEPTPEDEGPSPKRRALQPHADGKPETGPVAATTDAHGGHDKQDTGSSSHENFMPPLQSLLPAWSSQRPLFQGSILDNFRNTAFTSTTCSGKKIAIKLRKTTATASYESMAAARSKTKDGRATRSYYGVEIHELITAAGKPVANKLEQPRSRMEAPPQPIEPESHSVKRPRKSLLWTEKYRARKFRDLCGDDGTNRMVLRWLKKWDPIVFPGAPKPKPVVTRRPGMSQTDLDVKAHRKILMLTGPPGLGKTTLAHVCAKQAGYEVIEVNASDDRGRDVVKNLIRTSLATESVKTVSNSKMKDAVGHQKVARPVCVVVDEVDGVTSGSGASGEGGFVRALIDLVLTDQKNTSESTKLSAGRDRKTKKGDDFRLMRPLILICNDVYHPALRPLRQSNLAEIIHVGRPSVDAVVGRLKAVFEKEGIPCEKDASRKLCEAAWGIASGIDARRHAESTVQGDLRGIMVVGEWVAAQFRSSVLGDNCVLTRQWIERNILQELASNTAGARGLGRGSARDIVNRLFQEGGGFPKQAMDLSGPKSRHELPESVLGFGEQQKKYSMDRLQQMINTSGEIGNILTDIFAQYPEREFNDDIYLTKPNEAYEWLYFYDSCQSRLYASQDWELSPYLCQPVLACHHLFASPKNFVTTFEKRWVADGADAAPMPFSGPRADYQSREAEKQTRAQLQALQAQLSPSLTRLFRSPEDVATDFLPYLARILAPDVKPVVVGGSQGSMASVRKESERAMVRRASEVLADMGIALLKGKIEDDSVYSRGPQYVYRMEPDIDALSTFETGASILSSQAPTRYAVRQVLDQELQRTIAMREMAMRQARFQCGAASSSSLSSAPPSTGLVVASLRSLVGEEEPAKSGGADSKEAGSVIVKDFFGRVIEARPLAAPDGNGADGRAKKGDRKVWVTFHEGQNNAVRKPISLEEFMRVL